MAPHKSILEQNATQSHIPAVAPDRQEKKYGPIPIGAAGMN